MFKSVLFLIGGIIANGQVCQNRCGDKKLQVFFLADMSMNLCNNDTMVKYMDGVAEFAKQAEEECSGGFGIGYGVFGDRADLNPLFCHTTYVDVTGTGSGFANVVSKFDFQDGVGLSSKAFLGDVYQRAVNQYWEDDAVKILITLTNDEYGVNNGSDPDVYVYGACSGGCDCPGSYMPVDMVTDALKSHDVNLGLIVTPSISDFYQNTVTENGWNAVVESPIQTPPTNQIWRIVEKFTSPHVQNTTASVPCEGQFVQHYLAIDRSRIDPTEEELDAIYSAYEDLICTLQRYQSEGVIPGFEVGVGYFMTKNSPMCHAVLTDLTDDPQTAIDALKSIVVAQGTTKTHIEELYRYCTQLQWRSDSYKVITMVTDDVPQTTEPGAAELNMTDTGLCPEGCYCPGEFYDLQTTGDKMQEVGAHVSILSLTSYHDYLAQWQGVISDGKWDDFAYVTQLHEDSNLKEILWDSTFKWCKWTA